MTRRRIDSSGASDSNHRSDDEHRCPSLTDDIFSPLRSVLRDSDIVIPSFATPTPLESDPRSKSTRCRASSSGSVLSGLEPDIMVSRSHPSSSSPSHSPSPSLSPSSVFRMCLVVVMLLSLSFTSSVDAFNLDTENCVRHRGPSRSMFGFSVAEHKEQGYSWVLVGAPEAQTNQPGVTRGGAVFRCDVNADDSCQEIEFDRLGNNNNSKGAQIDKKSHQWFGATVSKKPPFPSDFPLPQVRINSSRRRSITLQVAYNMTQNSAVQKKITVLNQHNEKLVGVLHDTGSMEIVVLCHGFRSSKDFNTMVNLAVSLEKEGISAFRLDFPGNGESEGSFQYGNYRREADDLHSVVEYFNGTNRKVTAVLGHSKGGDVVLLYASKYHDVQTVINLSGRYNLEKGIAERLGKDFLEIIKKDSFIDVKNRAGNFDYRVTEESLMVRLNTNMHDACLQIDKGCRVLTVHGSADEIIPMEDALEFDKIIPNHKLHIIEGANHSYTSHQAELTSVVLPFIKEGLQYLAAELEH